MEEKCFSKFNGYSVKDAYARAKIEKYVTPDSFDGSDAEKIQKAVNMLTETGGTILIDRAYVIDKTIVLSHASDITKKMITFIGTGSESEIVCDTDACFEGNKNLSANGGFKFINVTFKGSGTVFRCSASLIRMIFIGCEFYDVDYAVFASDEYLQTIYFDCCYFKHIKECAIWCVRFFDVSVNNCCAEDSKKFFQVDPANISGTLRIVNSCIEGFSDTAITVGRTHGVVITGNYFEWNKIDIDFVAAKRCTAIEISGNHSEHPLISSVRFPARTALDAGEGSGMNGSIKNNTATTDGANELANLISFADDPLRPLSIDISGNVGIISNDHIFNNESGMNVERLVVSVNFNGETPVLLGNLYNGLDSYRVVASVQDGGNEIPAIFTVDNNGDLYVRTTAGNSGNYNCRYVVCRKVKENAYEQ